MAIKAYGTNLRPEHYDTIKAMVGIFTKEPVEILDLISYGCDPQFDDIILVFGRQAKHKCSDKPVKAKLEFPEIEKLQKETGEEPIRIAAAKKLQAFEKLYSSGQLDKTKEWKKTVEEEVQTASITMDALPSDYPTADQVLALETSLRKKNKTEWRGTTKDGRSIRLTILPEESNADINMTFAELYAVSNLMDKLNVKEIEVVLRPDSNRESFT
jgi:hypothetical protein